MSGSDVSALQTFLSQNNTIYPQGLITGYYGFLTQAAVSNFQGRNEIDPVGRVGPVTLPILNLQISTGMNNAEGARLTNNSNSAGTIYNTGTNNTLANTGGIAPTISSVAIAAGRNSVAVSWNTDQAAKGVVYYNTSPLLLSTSLTNVGVTGGFSAMTDTSLRNYQSVTLSNLSSNTTYYYMIYTTDQMGNVSVSWPSTFQTSY
jgi:peptidoglycan hydrolase-like protein with peptidoglycan-binding domain